MKILVEISIPQEKVRAYYLYESAGRPPIASLIQNALKHLMEKEGWEMNIYGPTPLEWAAPSPRYAR